MESLREALNGYGKRSWGVIPITREAWSKVMAVKRKRRGILCDI